MNLFTKQKQTHRLRKQTYGYQKGKGMGERQTGVWDQQIQTITYRMDKQQGPTVQHRELYIQYPVINGNGKEYKKEYIYV